MPMKKSDLLSNGPKTSKRIFIMAHGAGAPMDSDWMNSLTELLVKKNIHVVRFEFPYMSERRETGKKRPPNSSKILQKTWYEVIELCGGGDKVVIGGKSMGGRQASLIADEVGAKGLISLGFPFHAPGKEPGERITHLAKIKTPTLIVQGSRDPMGTREEIKNYKLSRNIKFCWLEDGDHSFKPRKKSGFTLEEHLEKAAEAINQFLV